MSRHRSTGIPASIRKRLKSVATVETDNVPQESARDTETRTSDACAIPKSFKFSGGEQPAKNAGLDEIPNEGLDAARAPLPKRSSWSRLGHVLRTSRAAFYAVCSLAFFFVALLLNLLLPDGTRSTVTPNEQGKSKQRLSSQDDFLDMSQFPQPDIGGSERMTVTESDVARMMSDGVRVPPPPSDFPDLHGLVQKKAAQNPKHAQSIRSSSGKSAASSAQNPQSRLASRDASVPETPRRRRAPGAFRTGGVLKDADTSSSNKLQLEPGQKIFAELEIGVSSNHNGAVLAKIKKDVSCRGSVALHAGDVLKGRASNDGDRMYIDFSEVSSGDRKLKISGYATEGGLPGLVAEKRQATLQDRSRAGVVQGGLEAAKHAAVAAAAMAAGDSIPGEIAGDLASSATSRTINEIQRDSHLPSNVILQLAQGKSFDVVVTGE